MSGPCGYGNSIPVWAVVVTAVLSHARGTLLLLRSAVSWFRSWSFLITKRSRDD